MRIKTVTFGEKDLIMVTQVKVIHMSGMLNYLTKV